MESGQENVVATDDDMPSGSAGGLLTMNQEAGAAAAEANLYPDEGAGQPVGATGEAVTPDGTIDWNAMAQRLPIGVADAAARDAMFQACDYDGDGVISLEESKRGIRESLGVDEYNRTSDGFELCSR